MVSLMYGLPLTEADRSWRALPGRTGLLYLYPVATTATVPESVTLIILPYIYSAHCYCIRHIERTYGIASA